MYTVVVAVTADRGLEVARYVTTLAEDGREVEAIVVNVFEEFEVADEAGVVNSADLFEDVEPPEIVDAVTSDLESAGVDVTVRHEHGDPVTEIMRVAEEVDADTIAVESRKRSPTGKAIFGSTAQRLVLEADRPVTVMTEPSD
ncbi:universal stress protein [Natrarchaeobaculum aegyptiacum]|uniref:Universal stress protein UspA n=1 Tax=Natrarchaeobaculum aegyptiacum TaxID=745377 RepID=A0A2Z2I0K7_9EURY|nr:universal stress protein [Natrarchaeobaculum aegyptiacum]ARS89718.1 universal stress protein UspA [Natrarchaeobaculum aegyptiacum]